MSGRVRPSVVGMDLIPHVIAESLQPFDVDQSNHDATRNTGRSAHRGGQDSVLGAVASQIAGDFIGRGKCDPKVLVPDVLENPMVDPSSFLPGIDCAPVACSDKEMTRLSALVISTLGLRY